MNAQQWQRLRRLLDEALDLPIAERADFIASLPEDCADLRNDLGRLLSEHGRERPMLDERATRWAVPLLRNEVDDDARADEVLGRQFGAYRLTRLLGIGGMGLVYLAERVDGKFSQQVALKVVQAGTGASAHERFERERQILAGLIHPNIAALYDGGELADGQAFYTMEYVDGIPVTQFCLEHRCTVDQRVRLLRDIATALAYAHRNLVVHRDIKPSNILVSDGGQVKLLDFGIAKLIGDVAEALLTRTTAGPMTPDYAAPEQFRKEPITVATDVYQFGMLCFRLLTGGAPYRADPEDPYAWARAVAEEEPMTLVRGLDQATATTAWGDDADLPRVRRQLGRDLDAVVAKALAKVPADRYGSMDALGADLDAYLTGRPVSARRASAGYRIARFVRRHRYIVATASVALALLCATVVVAIVQARVATREAERANAVAKFLISLFQVSDPGINRGEKLSANQILQRGATQLETEMTAQPQQRARLLTVIGEVYSALGDFARARVPLQNAIDIQRASADTDPIDFGHSLRTLAWTTHRQGDPKAALALLAEAQAVLDDGSTRALDELAGVHSYKALALKALGDFTGARSELETALATADRAGMAESVKTAAIHNNLALLLRDRGDAQAALAELQRALAIYRREYGEDHYRTIGTTQNLAMVMLDLGDTANAQPLLARTSAQNLRLFGEANSDFANAQNMLGNIARQDKRYDDSLAYYARAETSYRAAVGDNHPFLAFPPYNMGETEFARGNYTKALAHFDRSLALRRQLLAPDHPEIAESLAARCEALLALRRYAEAKLDAESSLVIRRAKLAADSPAIVETLYRLGLAEYASGDHDAAKRHWDEALASARRHGPADGDALKTLQGHITAPQSVLDQYARTGGASDASSH